jgi:hypothetical protein
MQDQRQSGTAQEHGLDNQARARLLLLIITLIAPVVFAVPASSAAPTMSDIPITYRGFSYGASFAGNATNDKPQSKVWWNDGSWWSLMLDPTDSQVQVFELMPDHTWRPTGTVVDNRPDSTGDALWDGTKLYVASRQASSPLRVVRFSYSPSTRRYTGDAGFPLNVNTGGSESAAIAKDSTGRLWITYTRSKQVWVAHTTTSETTWSAPFVPPVADTTITSDDISSIVAFKGRVGVMWSNQTSGTFRFAVHQDGAAADAWTLETALQGTGMADDHINLKTLAGDASGRVHAAIKTGQDELPGVSPSDPLVMVLTRSEGGTWNSAVAGTVADKHTRPMIVLDESNDELIFLAVRGSLIMYKRSSLSSIVFPAGRGDVFMQQDSTRLNSPSGSKHPVNSTTGLVILASSITDYFYYHGEMAIRGSTPVADTAAPSVPSDLSAVADSTSSVRVRWTASSDNVGVTGYRLFRNGAEVAQPVDTLFTDGGLSAATTYSYEVAAVDAAGNTSARSAPVSVTTPAVAPTTAISFRAATAGSNATATSLTIERPAGTSAGDLLLASVDVRGKPAVSAPAGWTLLRRDQAGNTMTKATYYKVASSGEATSYTWTFSAAQGAAGTLSSYVGVSPQQPVEVAAGQTNARSTTITAPAVTVSGGAMVVGLFGHAASVAISPPPSFTERAEASGGSSYQVTSESADRTWATAGTTGTLSATATATAVSVGHTVALRPAG